MVIQAPALSMLYESRFSFQFTMHLKKSFARGLEFRLTNISFCRKKSFPYCNISRFLRRFPPLLTRSASLVRQQFFTLVICGSTIFIGSTSTQSSNDKSSLLSDSRVWDLLKNLFRDCDKGNIPTTSSDPRFIEISGVLLTCMRQHLADLKKEEHEELSRKISASDSSESFVPIVGMNSQDGVDGDLVSSRPMVGCLEPAISWTSFGCVGT